MSDQVAAKIQEALRKGDGEAAEAICRRALARRPRDAELHLQLGQILRTRGDRAAAETAVRRALALAPQLGLAWRDLAVLALESGRLTEAEQASARLRALLPQQSGSAFLRGHVLGLLHRFDEAEREFTAIRNASGAAQARLGLVGDALARRNAPAALFHAQRMVEWLPQHAAAWDALGQAAALAQDWPASAAALRRATELAPADLAIWQRRDAALDAQRRGGDEVVGVRERLLELQPDSADALEQLALAQIGAHRTQAAAASLHRLLQRDPQRLTARWVLFHTPALPCFASTDERSAWLHDFEHGLAEFEERQFDAATARNILGSVPNFALAFQDGAQLALHRRHAQVVRRLLDTATDGAYADVAPRPLRQGRRRIGVVSSCLHQHSITRAWAEALLDLPADAFELCVFHTGTRDDAMVQRFRTRADRYAGGADSFANWTKRLREAELDVLVFLDLGLDVVNQCLAALRHAPVQISTWAHPVTSGAATIDYFVSATDSEPATAQTHYSERLHCLPRLGGCFATPTAPLLVRSESATTRLVCAQNLYKLHPLHDALFARILARTPDATLEFLTAASAEQVAGFERRLQQRLHEHAVDPARVRVQPALPAEDYRRRIAEADLLLDTQGFSGGITTLDALWQERSWLTLPGECMRGRQSMAMLGLLGLDELVAQSADDYVERAVALAAQPERRHALEQAIAERKQVLFEDRGVCQAFAAFLHSVQPPAHG